MATRQYNFGPMQKIQDLIFNDGRLYCPDHPSQELEEGATVSEHGSFSMVCTAKLGDEHNCMKSAQWSTKSDYEKAIKELKAANEMEKARGEQQQQNDPWEPDSEDHKIVEAEIAYDEAHNPAYKAKMDKLRAEAAKARGKV
jgi:hypothetical protein